MFHFKFLFFKLFILAYRKCWSAENAYIYLLTPRRTNLWITSALLQVLLVKLQLIVADGSAKLFDRSVII